MLPSTDHERYREDPLHLALLLQRESGYLPAKKDQVELKEVLRPGDSWQLERTTAAGKNLTDRQVQHHWGSRIDLDSPC